jgi:mannose-6-phosphate isomerase-like protein (cupin superfamily)
MRADIEVIELDKKFQRFAEHWHPKIVAELNNSYVKIAKLKGEFVWHKHDDEDELFWVTAGHLVIKLRDRDLSIGPGQLVVIPKGVEHMPVAAEEACVVLLEPKSTLNTGDVESDRTVDAEWI